MQNKTDLRVVKTKKAIENALIELLKEKKFEAITVQEIVDTAMINRKTFYVYYHDKYDLLEQLAEAFVCEVKKTFDIRRGHPQNMGYYNQQAVAVFKNYLNSKELILVLLHTQTKQVDVYRKLQDIFQRFFIEEFGSDGFGTGDMQLQAQLFSAIELAALEYYLRTGKVYDVNASIAELKSLMQKMSSIPKSRD
jgi:Transcriptional regulator